MVPYPSLRKVSSAINWLRLDRYPYELGGNPPPRLAPARAWPPPAPPSPDRDPQRGCSPSALGRYRRKVALVGTRPSRHAAELPDKGPGAVLFHLRDRLGIEPRRSTDSAWNRRSGDRL